MKKCSAARILVHVSQPPATAAAATRTSTGTSAALLALVVVAIAVQIRLPVCAFTAVAAVVAPSRFSIKIRQSRSSQSLADAFSPSCNTPSAVSSSMSTDSIDTDTSTGAAASGSVSVTPQRIGFLGCGTIASAIATGLATQSSVPIASIVTTRRSESKSSALVEQFPDLVKVYDDAQSIVDEADIVFVCVLPEHTSELLRSLTFKKGRHTVISLVSTSTLAQLKEDTQLSKERIFKCICLPAVARHEGVCLITPKSSNNGDNSNVVLQLLESLGGYVEASTEEQMSAMMVPSGLMGSVYGMMKQSRDWLTKNGGDISKSDASFLVGRLFYGMIADAERRCREEDVFEELIEEQTPGGLNEQALRNWEGLGALDSLDDVQDALLERISGKGDGSLKK